MIVTWLTCARPWIRRRHRARPSAASAAVALALALALAATLPATASADVGAQILNRCGHLKSGESLSGYTVAQYKQALQEMPTEVLEYSNCQELIYKAELAAAAHKGGSGASQGGGGGPGSATGSGAGGAVEPTPAQQRILEATRRESLTPVHLGGGETVLPGVVHPDLASATSSLPTPVLVVIALVIAGLLLLAGKEIRERIARSDQS
jgi:hypothetical protein